MGAPTGHQVTLDHLVQGGWAEVAPSQSVGRAVIVSSHEGQSLAGVVGKGADLDQGGIGVHVTLTDPMTSDRPGQRVIEQDPADSQHDQAIADTFDVRDDV